MQCISLLSLGGKYLKMMAFDISFLLPSMAWKCFGAGLQVLKHDMTSVTSCRNVISIEHKGSQSFLLYLGSFCFLKNEKNVRLSLKHVILFYFSTNFQNTKLSTF